MVEKLKGINMEARYKRDLNSNYMILSGKIGKEEPYEVRMITENRIYGLLPCVNQKHEEYTEYYYEITGSQSMRLLYERRKLNCEQLRELLRELERILKTANEYLLNPDHFVLNPEFMYLHSKTEKLHLCYFPEYEKTIRESFLEWAEYLLGKLDKNDTKGIEFGYDLYQNALEPNFSLLEILKKHTKTEVETPQVFVEPPVDVQEEILEKTGSWKNFFKKKNKKPQLSDYIAEADHMGSGAVLFLKEQSQGFSKETACLQEEKREGLFLKSCNTDYPDFQIVEKTFVIGKLKESVDGCIPASTVSRLHARITFNGTTYFLEDLNSTNGTWADQIQLNPYEPFMLENNMRIIFASVEYVVQL